MEHVLTIRVIGLTVLILAVGAGATTYIGAQGAKQDARAQANVRAAAHAAEAWYQDPFGGHGSYRQIDAKALVQEAPVVSLKVRAFPLAGGRAYCLADVEATGHSAYFIGGDVDAVAELHGAIPERVTLDHASGSDAESVCAGIS